MAKPIKTDLELRKVAEQSPILKEALALIPAGNSIHQLPADIQWNLLSAAVSGVSTTDIVKALMEEGYQNFGRTQVNRIKKRLMPAVMKNNLPNTLFASGKLRDQISHIEFVLNEHYARVIDKINTEDDLKTLLVPASKVTFAHELAYQDFRKDYIRYETGQMDDIEERAFLTVYKPRGYDPGLTKDLEVLVKLFESLVNLKVKLKDPGMTLNDNPDDENKPKEGVKGVLPQDVAQKVAEAMRKRALGIAEEDEEPKPDEPPK